MGSLSCSRLYRYIMMMGVQDWIVVGIVVLAVVYGIWRVVRSRREGCDGMCASCMSRRLAGKAKDKTTSAREHR